MYTVSLKKNGPAGGHLQELMCALADRDDFAEENPQRSTVGAGKSHGRCSSQPVQSGASEQVPESSTHYALAGSSVRPVAGRAGSI